MSNYYFKLTRLLLTTIYQIIDTINTEILIIHMRF